MKNEVHQQQIHQPVSGSVGWLVNIGDEKKEIVTYIRKGKWCQKCKKRGEYCILADAPIAPTRILHSDTDLYATMHRLDIFLRLNQAGRIEYATCQSVRICIICQAL